MLPPVIIVGDGLAALGAIRTLGRAGLECYAITRQPSLKKSRYSIELPTDTQRSLDAQVREILSRAPIGEAYYLPCSDSLVRKTPQLLKLFPQLRSSVPSDEILEIFIDKQRFAQKAQELGIPIPRSYWIGSFEPASTGRYFIKPRDSQRFFAENRMKASFLDSEGISEELFRHECARRHFDPHLFLAQEYIAEPAQRHIFLDGYFSKSQSPVSVFARQRLRAYPTHFGNSSACRPIALSTVEPAFQALIRFLSAVGFSGIFSAEFVYDTRDQLFKIIEVNARPWWYTEYAHVCGHSILLNAYRDAFESSPLPDIGTKGKQCIHLYYDFFALRAAHSSASTWLEWSGSLLGAHHPWFALDDPLPAFTEGAQTIAQTVMGQWRKH